MMRLLATHLEVIAAALNSGQIGVIRTDTLYGLVCRADYQLAVERIFTVKGRDDTKAPIVLVANIDQLYDTPDVAVRRVLDRVWPGKVSVIVPSFHAPDWIARGNGSVAYRLPASEWLNRLLHLTGPLVAPSANLQGQSPAASIDQAIAYFGDKVDFYVDGGRVRDNTPSQLLRVDSDSTVSRLR